MLYESAAFVLFTELLRNFYNGICLLNIIVE